MEISVKRRHCIISMMQFLVLFGASPDLLDCPTESLYQMLPWILKLCNLMSHTAVRIHRTDYRPSTIYAMILSKSTKFCRHIRQVNR